MTLPSPPGGYDISHHVDSGRSDCHITVGFDQIRGYIPRFLVQLHYQATTEPVQWEQIARMDHNETSSMGHDVYREGLHVDIARQSKPTVHLMLSHGPLPQSRGKVIRGCIEYFGEEIRYFVDVFEERQPPGGPPAWSDGGESTRGFIRANPVDTDMSRESPAAEDEPEVLSPEGLSEVLAEVEDTTPEEIERGADEVEIDPPSEATVVDE